MRFWKQLIAVGVVAFAGGTATTAALEWNPYLTLIVGSATAVLSVVVYRWVVGRTERRAVVELAGNGAGAAVVRGVAIGIGWFVMVIVNIAFLAVYQVNGIGSVSGAVALLGFMAGAAVTEELLYRGILFRILEEHAGTWIALALTSCLFGLSHLLNENASLWGAIAIAIEAGAMLGAAYAATRSLWLPIGVHFGWNFAAGGIFSTEVSGNGTPQGLLDSVTSGHSMVTGGDFGPEGSLYTMVFGVILTVVFLWLAHRRGNLVPRRRADRADTTTTTISR